MVQDLAFFILATMALGITWNLGRHAPSDQPAGFDRLVVHIGIGVFAILAIVYLAQHRILDGNTTGTLLGSVTGYALGVVSSHRGRAP